MNQFFRRVLMATAMTTAGVAVGASGAFAQAAPPANETVNFQGTVGSVCIFSNVVDGVLANSSASVLTSDPVAGGTEGSVDLSCTGAVDVSVSLPQDNASTTDLLTTALNYESAITVGVGGPTAFNAQGGGASAPAFVNGPVDETVTVGMFLDANNPIPEGAYDYNVIVTATPL